MNYGLIVEGNPFSRKLPILGRSCRYYAEKALESAGVTLAEDAAALEASKEDMLLVLREDAATMSSQFLRFIIDKAENKPMLCKDLEEEKPLLLAVPGKWIQKMVQGLEAPLSMDKLAQRCEELNCPVLDEDEGYLELMPVINAETYQYAVSSINEDNIHHMMHEGVIFLDVQRVLLHTGVQIGTGTIVYPGNVLEGETVIGENCTLYPNNRMNNAKVGSGVTVESSVLIDCVVGDKTTVGPYAYLRPKANIGAGCRIGDFVEIKNSNIDEGTKVSHLAYVGDSDLGKGINVSCGVVFSNYDGKTKNRCVVEDNAFLGCNCNLVAPVHVGKNAYLAAGSTVVENVPEDALLIARSRGTIKEGWVKRRKEAGKL